MKRAISGILLVLASAAHADLIVECDVKSSGRSLGSCKASVSSLEGTGEIKLAQKEMYRMSSDQNCPMNEYDLVIKRVKSPQAAFDVSIVKMGRKLKTKNSLRVVGADFITMTAAVSYSVNDTGLFCSVANERIR